MRKIQYLIIILISATIIQSCSEASGLTEKKSQLEEYKRQLAELKANIRDLEADIAKQDTSFDAQSGNVLVSTYQVNPGKFVHRTEVRGSVASKKNITISSETMGRVEAIPVKEGMDVKAGQLLMKLDANILENNIAEVQTQLELATTVFERQANLWKKNIGTEIRYLEAKNNKESLERRLKTLNAQLRQAYIRAPFTGTVDAIPVKAGEMAQPGLPLIRIVNLDDVYIQADISEDYLGSFKSGDEVKVHFPTQDITVRSKITSVGKVISQDNRTFSLEVSIPGSAKYEFRPNQVVVLTLTDYVNDAALSVPTNVIQSDEKGEYLYTLESRDGKEVAKKVWVKTGKTFESKTEILSGLSPNEKVIDKGFRDVNEGVEVSHSTASL